MGWTNVLLEFLELYVTAFISFLVLSGAFLEFLVILEFCQYF